MDHREQTPEQERITTLALAVQEMCFGYFDGHVTPAEWLQLVVDAVQQHQAEAKPEPEQAYDPVAAKKDHPGLIFCSIPGCGQNGDEYINGEWYCRVHKDQVEVRA